MFERNDINDLFLASITVSHPDNDRVTDIAGNFCSLSIEIFEYSTILKKHGDKFIDLYNPKAEITMTKDPNKTSYIIDYMEPLSKYYTSDGKRKKVFSNRQAIIMSKTCYDEFFKDKENAQKAKVYK